MGRSGLERAVARSFVVDLKAKGAEVTVVKGDVANFSDVTNAVSLVNGPLGGVIQAAMGLSVSLDCLHDGLGAYCHSRSLCLLVSHTSNGTLL